MISRPGDRSLSAVKWRLDSKGELVSGLADPVFNTVQALPTCCGEVSAKQLTKAFTMYQETKYHQKSCEEFRRTHEDSQPSMLIISIVVWFSYE